MELVKDKVKEKISDLNENGHVVKYAVPAAVILFGLFIGGGNLAQGIYAGILSAAGFWILTEKLKAFYPSVYNWLLAHSVEADFAVSFLACMFLGFSVTGIIAAAVVNLLVSVILENYRENVGIIEDIEPVTAREAAGAGITKIKDFFNLGKDIMKDAVRKDKVHTEHKEAA